MDATIAPLSRAVIEYMAAFDFAAVRQNALRLALTDHAALLARSSSIDTMVAHRCRR
jgi:hypothetical protein